MKNNTLVMEEDGSVITYYFSEKKDKPNLKQLQKMVGGYIEVVRSADTEKQIVIDEEGKLKGKPINKDATELYVGEAQDDTSAMWDYDAIVGDAVILSGEAKID